MNIADHPLKNMIIVPQKDLNATLTCTLLSHPDITFEVIDLHIEADNYLVRCISKEHDLAIRCHLGNVTFNGFNVSPKHFSQGCHASVEQMAEDVSEWMLLLAIGGVTISELQRHLLCIRSTIGEPLYRILTATIDAMGNELFYIRERNQEVILEAKFSDMQKRYAEQTGVHILNDGIIAVNLDVAGPEGLHAALNSIFKI